MSPQRKLVAVILVDLVLATVAGLGIYQTHFASTFPFELDKHDGGFFLQSDFAGLQAGSNVQDIAGHDLKDADELEFYLDGMWPGADISVTFGTPNGETLQRRVRTVPSYTAWYTTVQILVTLTFFGFGLFLWFKRKTDPAAQIAHWLAFSAGSIVALSPGSHTVLPPTLDLVVRLFYVYASLSTGTLYIHFALLFPSRQPRKAILSVVYTLSAGLFVWAGMTGVNAYWSDSLAEFRAYIPALRTCQLYFSILGLFASYLFARSYKRTIETSERRKIKWALAGSAFSVLTYVFLWVVPQLIGRSQFVPEELILISSILAPITITIAIARHRIFDIDAVLSRTATYALAASALVLLYVVVAAATAAIIGTRLPLPLAAGIAVLVAILFEPMKVRLQRWIDYRFFRVRYDFREAQIRLQDGLQSADDRETILDMVQATIDHLLHPTSVEISASSITALSANPQFIEAGLTIPRLEGSSIVVTAPLLAGEEGYSLNLGPKRSGARYSQEDLDLISSAALQASLRLERITMRERLEREQGEAESARELNRMRSLILSSITHDLKSPLTSIHMFAELLESSVSAVRDREYLNIIEGESERLTALIDNVLDYSRIERGLMAYDIEPLSLSDVVRSALKPMSYLLTLQSVNLDVAYGSADPIIAGDRGALQRAVTNLVTNAIKYSGMQKDIRVAVGVDHDTVSLQVSDRGIGIPERELTNIFQPYYRTIANAKHAPGAGLGLATVHHVVQAHSGTIAVESVVGTGTTFTLTFPLLHAQDPDH
jgi:signal transduction histidine kinase